MARHLPHLGGLHLLIGLPLNRLLIPRATPPIRATQVQEIAGPAPMSIVALLASELEQNIQRYSVITKRLLVLTQTKVAQPSREAHVGLLLVWRSVMRSTSIEFLHPGILY